MQKVLNSLLAKLLVIWLLLFALFGCGGDTTTSNTTNTAPTAVASAKPRQVICLFGDSTQYSRSQFDYLVQQEVSAIYPDSVVYNFGVSGSVTEQGIYGIAGMRESLDTNIKQYGCTVVTANYGINDAAKLQVSPELYLHRMKQFEGIVVGNGAMFILETPNPILNAFDTYLQNYTNLALTNFNTIDHYSAIKMLPSWQSMLPDGVHPNDELLLFKTKLLMKRIMEELHNKYN